MRLEGSLDAFSLPDIFSLLSMTKKTGGLHLRRGGAHGVVWFTTGALTGGACDVTRQSLARRLVGAGLVADDALQTAVDRAAGGEVGVARALQQAGAIDEGALHDLAAEHVVDTVFDLLRWPDGDFAFVVDEPNPDDVGVSRQVDDVVAEARRRLEAWGSVAAAVPSPQTVLAFAAAPDVDPQLTRDEWSLLALVDGRRTVAEIVTLRGHGEFTVVSALADLVTRGLLRCDDGDGVSALQRRYDALARLETAPPSGERGGQPAPPAVEPASQAAEPANQVAEPAGRVAEPQPPARFEPVASSAAKHADETDRGAQVTRLPLVGAGRHPQDAVTPQRPEPFLPPRRPEHPEEPMPTVAAVAAGGGAGAAAAPASYIERDPSVNKSLLLRLIAGVRGL